jgi:RimJ/RimL family protein N-acetyltransferase
VSVERSTQRLLLRRWLPSDRAPFAALNADPEVRRYFVGTLSRAESDASIDRFENTFDDRGFGLWAVERRDTGEFIGFTGLNPMPDGIPGAGGVEVGWRLAREHWGFGFATEAALESLRFAFTVLALDEVHSITAVGNARSRAVMERIGMQQRDFFEHPAVPEGNPLREHVRYVIGSAS